MITAPSLAIAAFPRGVIAVKVRVHDVANRLRAERSHGVDDLLVHLAVHRVDEEDAVVPD
jgi:hypothetical protein